MNTRTLFLLCATMFMVVSAVPKILWQTNIGSTGFTGMTGGDGKLFVGANNLIALDSNTGKIVWTATGVCATGYYLPLYYNSGSSKKVFVIGNDQFYAVDANTGAILYNTSSGSPTRCGMSVANGVLYVATGTAIQAVNPNTYQLLWTSASTGSQTEQIPVVVGNTVLAAGGYPATVYAFSATTGATLWSKTLNSDVSVSLSSDGTRVFAATSTTVHALTVASGFQVWSASISGSLAQDSGVVYFGGYVYQILHSGPVNKYNAATGKLMWSYNLGTGSFTNPIIAGGIVYATNFGGVLYMLDDATGSVLYNISINNGQCFGDFNYFSNGVYYASGYANLVTAVLGGSAPPPGIFAQFCADYQCHVNCTTIQEASGCSVFGSGGSVHRSCVSNSLSSTFFNTSMSCSGVPSSFTTYGVNQCVPLAVGGSWKLLSCS